jgi:galactokinase
MSGAASDSAVEETLRQEFGRVFGRAPEWLARAGGRVNLIGEHTDYHEGYVLPAAIDLGTVALGAKRADGRVRVFSANGSRMAEGRLGDLAPPESATIESYLLAPFYSLRVEGLAPPGADVWLRGDVPLGGGLSSSASLHVALCGLGAALSDSGLDPLRIARLAHRAEHGYCRVPCGMMDQLASACGSEGHALLIDCRTQALEPIPIPPSLALLVFDSGVKHAVGSGEYARRQQECARGLDAARRIFPDLASARDLDGEKLQAAKERMDPVAFRRLRHVVTENARVLQATQALRAGDGEALGRLLCASHQSLRDDYQVSCLELDVLVDAAARTPGALGARLTGAGFGGNALVLAKAGTEADTASAIAGDFLRATGRPTSWRRVRAGPGLSVRRFSESGS